MSNGKIRNDTRLERDAVMGLPGRLPILTTCIMSGGSFVLNCFRGIDSYQSPQGILVLV